MLAKVFGVAGCLLGYAAVGQSQFQNGAFGQPGGGFSQGQFQQYPQINPAYVGPNIYNPQTQPLSPYLNQFSSSPASRYYFGVRPGTVGGAGNFGGAPNIAFGGNRSAFFPQLAGGPDPTALPDVDPGSASVLPPAGHQVVFANTLGYFPGNFGRGFRPGLSGVGNNRTATPKR